MAEAGATGVPVAKSGGLVVVDPAHRTCSAAGEIGAFELGAMIPVDTDGGVETFGQPTGASGAWMIYFFSKNAVAAARVSSLIAVSIIALASSRTTLRRLCERDAFKFLFMLR